MYNINSLLDQFPNQDVREHTNQILQNLTASTHYFVKWSCNDKRLLTWQNLLHTKLRYFILCKHSLTAAFLSLPQISVCCVDSSAVFTKNYFRLTDLQPLIPSYSLLLNLCTTSAFFQDSGISPVLKDLLEISTNEPKRSSARSSVFFAGFIYLNTVCKQSSPAGFSYCYKWKQNITIFT